MIVWIAAETLGKLPNEIEEAFTPQDLAEFAAYVKIRNEMQKPKV